MRKPSIVAQRRAQRRETRRKWYEALKSDPKRWAAHRLKSKEYAAKRLERIKADPVLLKEHKALTATKNARDREYRRVYYNERYRLDPQFRKRHAGYMAKYKAKLEALGVERLSDLRKRP